MDLNIASSQFALQNCTLKRDEGWAQKSSVI